MCDVFLIELAMFGRWGAGTASIEPVSAGWRGTIYNNGAE